MDEDKIKAAITGSFDLIYQACGDNEIKALSTVMTMLHVISKEMISKKIISKEGIIRVFSNNLDRCIQGSDQEQDIKEDGDSHIMAYNEINNVLRKYFGSDYLERLLASLVFTARISAVLILDRTVSQDNVISTFINAVNRYRILFSNGRPKN